MKIGASATSPLTFFWTVDNTVFSANSPYWCTNEPNNYPGTSNVTVEGCVLMWVSIDI
jgi:hypothetical protein